MVQSFNNQVMFGHREWAILAENNKPMPVGLDNKPMIDKPLQKQLREPSEVEEEKPDDSIVGYMGDDEDVQQAQYNVMTLVNDTVGGLNNHIERINKELQILIGRNTNEIKGLKGELCVPFMKDNCDNEKTVEGCMECAEYYRGKFRLPEDCSVAVLNNHCNFKNTYPASAPPQGIDIGDVRHMRDKIRESPPRPCKEYGHFDCKVMTDQDRLGRSIPQFSQEDKKCIWDESDLSHIIKLDNPDNLSAKCRNLCSKHDMDPGNCENRNCYYNNEEGKCYEKKCELRMSSSTCSYNEEATSFRDVCGYSNHIDDDYFDTFMNWIQSDHANTLEDNNIGFHISLDGRTHEDHILPKCRSA